MADLHDFLGCKVIVYDEDNKKTVAQTEIIEHDKTTQTIMLRSPAFRNATFDRVALLIFDNSVPFEYKGTVRRGNLPGDQVEITLYNGKKRESRGAVRYPINTPAVVENWVIARKLVALPKPMEVTVVNLSASGCFLSASPGLLNVGTTFQLRLDMGGSGLLLNTTVVRIDALDKQTAEYGCKLNFTY